MASAISGTQPKPKRKRKWSEEDLLPGFTVRIVGLFEGVNEG